MISDREAELLDAPALRLLDIYKNEQYTSLLHEVDDIAKAAPLSAGAYGIASLACSAMLRYEEAAIAAETALGKEPNWAWLYNALSLARVGQQRLQEAVSAQRRAAALMPDQPAYGAHLARYLRLSGRTDEAIGTARSGLELHPNHTPFRNELGLALLDQGDMVAALAQFKAAQQAEPTEPTPYLNEGVLHQRAGAPGKARLYFREALRRHPGHIEAEDLLAQSFAGNSGVAKQLLAHLLTLGRVTAVGWLMISFLYYIFFRLLQFLWRVFPASEVAFQGLLWVLMAYLIVGFLTGRLLRFAFRSPWPR